jgi:hypothetical protein
LLLLRLVACCCRRWRGIHASGRCSNLRPCLNSRQLLLLLLLVGTVPRQLVWMLLLLLRLMMLM